MFVLAFLSINVIAVAMVTIALHRAPEGYEDELGFHKARQRKAEAEYRKADIANFGMWKSDTGKRKPESGDRIPESGG